MWRSNVDRHGARTDVATRVTLLDFLKWDSHGYGAYHSAPGIRQKRVAQTGGRLALETYTINTTLVGSFWIGICLPALRGP